MKAKSLSVPVKVMALSGTVLVFCAVWLSRDGIAAVEPVLVPPAQNDPSVQDKKPEIDIDTKIFLHRNGLVATTGRLPGRS